MPSQKTKILKATSFKTLKDEGWKFPLPSQATIPELFIIESMNDNDEKSGFFEGVRIAQILRLAGLKPKYFYIQDERELDLLVPVFRQSNYRYLHLSCHGDCGGFELTDGHVSFARFAEIFEGALLVRRLFVSACNAGQEELAHALHSTSRGIQSVTAPSIEISYDHAAAIWSAFYLSLLDGKPGKMFHKHIKNRIALLVKLFPYADFETKQRTSFLFAGYNPSKDVGPVPRAEAWTFESITHQYNSK